MPFAGTLDCRGAGSARRIGSAADSLSGGGFTRIFTFSVAGIAGVIAEKTRCSGRNKPESRPPREGGLVGLAEYATEPNHLQNVDLRPHHATNQRGRWQKGCVFRLLNARQLFPPCSKCALCLPISNILLGYCQVNNEIFCAHFIHIVISTGCGFFLACEWQPAHGGLYPPVRLI